MIRLKPRSMRNTRSFVVRTSVVLGVFLLVSNAAFVAAQAVKLPSDLMRTAIGGTQFMQNTDWYLALRTSAVIPSFGIAIIVFVVLALGHFFIFGAKDMSIRDDSDAIPWWSVTERVLHAILAVAFVVLFISGLMITFGRFLGGGSATLVMRLGHEYSGFVFTPIMVILALMWVRHGLFHKYDGQWFVKAGGYLGYEGKLVSGKFNAGQKIWYWFMVVFGILLAWSGFFLYFQLGGMDDMRFYQLLHFAAAVPIILMFVVHLYMTTIGVKGAFMGMINGRFSKTAAQNYHPEAPALKSGAQPAPEPAGSD